MSSLPKQRHLLPVTIGDDLYELLIGGPEKVVVIFYRRGLDCRGLEVDFDDLTPYVQEILYQKLKNFLSKNQK